MWTDKYINYYIYLKEVDMSSPSDNFSYRIAICFHLGYANRFNEFTPYIDNVLSLYPQTTDLYISYREDIDPRTICQSKYPNAVYFKCLRGCDIGAFLLVIDHFLRAKKQYHFIFKLHTKTNNPVFPHWKEELLEPIAGSTEQVKKVISTFEQHPDIGMIGGPKWILKQDLKDPIYKSLIKKYSLPEDGYFVGGTIFWVRFNLIRDFFNRPFIRQQLPLEYFKCELGKPSEPSYTHSWERLWGKIGCHCAAPNFPP